MLCIYKLFTTAENIAVLEVAMGWTAKYVGPASQIENQKCKRRSLNPRSRTSAGGHPLVSELHRSINRFDRETLVAILPF